MLTVLSPAKKLSKECFVKTNNHNLPQFLDDSVGLVKELKKDSINLLPLKVQPLPEK